MSSTVSARSRRRSALVLLVLCVVVASIIGRPAAAWWLADHGRPSPQRLPKAVGQSLADLKLINYYPKDRAWTLMWSEWSKARLTVDFDAMHKMHANAVRLFVSPAAFGWPKPSPRMLHELRDTVDLAAAAHLKVVLTAFDLWSAYNEIVDSNTWATGVLQPYANDPEIAFVETRNEVDVDNEAELAWLREQVPFDRKMLGTVPVTASVAGSVDHLRFARAKLVAAGIDFLDWHYFSGGSTTQIFDRLSAARDIAGKLPLFIGETGYSTLQDKSVSGSQAAEQQLQFYANVDWATKSLGLPDAAPWTFTDFDRSAIPADIRSGHIPAEYFYGLSDVSGRLKPAGLLTKAFFGDDRAPSVINGDFTVRSGGLAAGWRTYHASEGTFILVTGVSKSGGNSLQISRSTGDRAGLPSYDATLPLTPTLRHHWYRVAAWAKGTQETGVSVVALAWFDCSGNWLGDTTSAALAHGTTAWTRLEAAGPSPAGAAKVMVYLQSAHNTGASFFSNVVFSVTA